MLQAEIIAEASDYKHRMTSKGTCLDDLPRTAALAYSLICTTIGVSAETAIVVAICHGKGNILKSHEARKKAHEEVARLLKNHPELGATAYDLNPGGTWHDGGEQFIAGATAYACYMLAYAHEKAAEKLHAWRAASLDVDAKCAPGALLRASAAPAPEPRADSGRKSGASPQHRAPPYDVLRRGTGSRHRPASGHVELT